MPVHNKLEYTSKCVEMLVRQISESNLMNSTFQIVITDDGSTDGTDEWLEKNYPEVLVLKGDGNLWWSGGVNVAAKYMVEEGRTDYLLLWNNDIIADSNYFNEIDSLLPDLDENTIVGSKIYCLDPPDLVWSYGGVFNPRTGVRYMIGHLEPDGEKFQESNVVDWLPGMGTLIPINVVHMIGLWNEIEFPQYHGDSDFSYRAKLAGFKTIIYPGLKIWNDNSNSELMHEGKLKQLFRMISDKRSNLNLKKNLIFYRKYAKSPRAYWPLFVTYFRLFGGFIKWKILALFGKRKPA